MSDEAVQQEGATSIQDVAATLLVQVPSDGDKEPEQELATDLPEEQEDDIELAQEDEQEDSPEVPEGEEEQSQDDDLFLDVKDDDLISVVVDGEEREVTISDLKKSYSGEGAIEGRLQEVTEARREAQSLNAQLLERLGAEQLILTEALGKLDDSVFAAVIPPPPESMKQSDPKKYLAYQQHYENDQKRIQSAKNAVQKQLEEVKTNLDSARNEFAQQGGQVIAQEIPELVSQDAKVRNGYYSRMAETAQSYGYSEQEIQAAIDPRMFLLVRDAMLYRELQGKAKEVPDVRDLSDQKQKKVRRLRSGNTTTKQRAKQRSRDLAAVTKKAEQTGKVKDVAATLIKPRG